MTRPADGPDVEAFEAFYRSDYPQLVRFLLTLGATFTEAEDAAAEAMSSVFMRWSAVTSPRAWVRVAAQRQWMKAQIKQRDQELLAQRNTGPLVHRDVQLSEEVAEVLRLLRALPPTQRQVMAWLIDGYSTREIATLLGKPEATIRSSLRHARNSLQHLTRREDWKASSALDSNVAQSREGREWWLAEPSVATAEDRVDSHQEGAMSEKQYRDKIVSIKRQRN